MEETDDIQTVLCRVANDDCEAFRQVYQYYYDRLFRQALYYLNEQPERAQEVVADVFVALWQARKVLDKVKDPDAYCFIALKHAAARYVGKHYRRDTELLTEQLPEPYATGSRPDAELSDSELQSSYRRAVDKLPPRCAAVFRLVREEGKKYSEVAELLGISVKTVDNQMNKAVKILYEELKEHLFILFF